jgi:5-hydroxyisourate hydrolase-like protein (transthyretin family)
LQIESLSLASFLVAFLLTDFSHIFCFVIGPTSFAPIIEMAITIVEQSGGQYHVLLIIADGQVLCGCV